jgi:hypothetical protein
MPRVLQEALSVEFAAKEREALTEEICAVALPIAEFTRAEFLKDFGCSRLCGREIF